jgi:hypothetical protein
VENSLYSNQYNFEKTDWEKFENNLIFTANTDKFQTQLNDSITTSDMLKKEAEKLRDIILKAAEIISKKRITEYFKCW